MTGGRVVVLGPTGRNFAAGMSGGVAYVLDEQGDFPQRCNLEMVSLEELADPAEIQVVKDMIWSHAGYTGSRRAWEILSRWEAVRPCFVKVLPRDYARMLDAIHAAQQNGLSGEAAVMAAFEANKRDLARVGGN
jgi:glutamate synthase domain-containing protein 3